VGVLQKTETLGGFSGFTYSGGATVTSSGGGSTKTETLGGLANSNSSFFFV